MRRIAVTGSNGFIGKHLVSALQKDEQEVVEISRSKGLNICEWDTVKDLPECEVLVHLAAKTFVPDSFDNPREFYTANTQATINALELARMWNARVIYMSSYFYGPPLYLPVDEKHPLHPHNPYAQTKLLSEQLCEGYHRDFGIPVVAFRLFNIYGPGQEGNFLIPTIINQLKSGSVTLKDSRPKRDYIHVYDVVKAVQLAIEKSLPGFEVFNLATGTSYSVEEVINTLLEITNNGFSVTYTNEYRKGEVLDSVGSISKLKALCDFDTTINLKEGLETVLKESKRVDG